MKIARIKSQNEKATFEEGVFEVIKKMAQEVFEIQVEEQKREDWALMMPMPAIFSYDGKEITSLAPMGPLNFAYKEIVSLNHLDVLGRGAPYVAFVFDGAEPKNKDDVPEEIELDDLEALPEVINEAMEKALENLQNRMALLIFTPKEMSWYSFYYGGHEGGYLTGPDKIKHSEEEVNPLLLRRMEIFYRIYQGLLFEDQNE